MNSIPEITDDATHKRALARLEALFGSPRHSDGGREARALAKAISAYERVRFPMDPPDAVDAVVFELDRYVATLDELTEIFGTRSALVDFITRRKRPDADAKRELHERYDIDMETLSRPWREGEGWYMITEGHLPWRQELRDSALELTGIGRIGQDMGDAVADSRVAA